MLRNEENLMILGDININCEDKSDISTKQFMSILESYSYNVINSAPTRFNVLTGNHSTIDQIITRDEISDVVTLTSDEEVIKDISDHNLLIYIKPGTMNTEKNPRRLTTYRINKMKMINALKDQLPKLPININPQVYCEDIMAKIKELREMNTAKVTLKTRDNIKIIPD